jgi:hypothetical protein
VKKYSKLVAWIVVAVLGSLVGALTDGHVSTVEGVQLLIAGAGAVGVWVAGYLPAGLAWPKTAVAATVAALTLLVTYLGAGGWSGLTAAEVVNVALVVLAALGVRVVPTVPALAGVKARVHAAGDR